jgi:hypothetical protein
LKQYILKEKRRNKQQYQKVPRTLAYVIVTSTDICFAHNLKKKGIALYFISFWFLMMLLSSASRCLGCLLGVVWAVVLWLS